jgi:GNAT superfamily N-acetyltransferase
VDEWGPARAADFAALCELALPGERLTEDELHACCWDDHEVEAGVVLALPGGDGGAAACVQSMADRRVATVKLLAVEPAAQGLGYGRALLSAVQDWAWQLGADEIGTQCAPFYLWPGIDVRFTRALCQFESAGYWPLSAEVNMSCPSTHRAAPPDGVAVRRVLDDADVAAVLAFVDHHWANWVAECRRGIDHGACHAAFAGADVVGFACHSVNRAGWVGPMGTDPVQQRGGVGSALLGDVCKDLMVAGFPDAEIAWVGPVRFYAKAAGAAVSRTFRTYSRRRPR